MSHGPLENMLQRMRLHGLPMPPDAVERLRQAVAPAANAQEEALLMKAHIEQRIAASTAQTLANTPDREGWVYFGPQGHFSPDAWVELLQNLGGPQHYQLLVQSSGTGSQGPWQRGQMLISPHAQQQLKKLAPEVVNGGETVQ